MLVLVQCLQDINNTGDGAGQSGISFFAVHALLLLL
jgi:hypothetical protein